MGSMERGHARANPEDEQALAEYARALADAVDAALAGWVERTVARVLEESGVRADAATLAAAAAAGREARADTGARVRELLATDIDAQQTSPLALLRNAVRFPTEVLAGAGVPPVERDEFSVQVFPDDLYALAPATFGDIDPSLHEPGIAWGAAKAYVHLARRRAEGQP